MKKNLPTFALLFAMLASLLLFTQCTPETRPQTKEEMLADIEENYILTNKWSDQEIYSRYIGIFMVPEDHYTIDENSDKISAGDKNLSPKEVREIKKLIENCRGSLEKMPEIPKTIRNEQGEECVSPQIQSISYYIMEKVPYREVCVNYISEEMGGLFSLDIVTNLKDGTENRTVDQYRSEATQPSAGNQ